ncbi:MAG: hypothetical protein IJK25_11180 [Firmicutes bacterium]|nr:hypothetical protein [Bacillota bacterium]
MTISKKSIALLMALVLVLGAGIGGTIAWLQTKTATVTNTFTVGDIGTLTLTETKGKEITATEDPASADTNDTFFIVPGVDMEKDPTVNYKATDATKDVAVYLFVKVSGGSYWTLNSGHNAYAYSVTPEGATAFDALKFDVGTDWTYVTTEGTDAVFCKEVPAGVADVSYPVIKDSKITVSENLTKEQLKGVTAANFNLAFTAYAIQKDGLDTAAAAWEALNPTNP